MKYKYIVLYTISLLTSIACKAQVEELFFYDEKLDGYRQPNRIGLVVGNALNTKRASYGYNSSHNGLNITLRQEWYHKKPYSTLLDIGYIQKGFTNTVTKFFPNTELVNKKDYNTTVEYLNMSFMMKYQGKLGDFLPYFVIGGKIDIMIGKNSEFKYHNIGVDYNSLIPGLTYGIGINYNMKRDKYRIGIMFSQHFDFFNKLNVSQVEADEVDIDALSFINNTFLLNLVFSYEITWRKVIIFRKR